MNTKVFVPVVVLLLLAIGGFLLLSRQGTENGMQNLGSIGNEIETGDGGAAGIREEFVGVQSFAIPVLELSSSGQMGGASFTGESGGTRVSLNVTAVEGSQAAAIRLGSCPTPGEVAFELEPVTDGESETLLNVGVQDILVELPMALTVQASGSNSYSACGDLVLPSAE